MEKRVLSVEGMTCTGCEKRIERGLKKTPGVGGARANYARGRVEVEFDAAQVDQTALAGVIEALGYTVTESGTNRVMRGAGAAVLLLALWLIADRLGLTEVFARFPTAGEGMGYAVLFITGVATSVHCIAMCGGINLSQTMGGERGGVSGALRSALLYNGGRIVSYTVVGGVIGAAGMVIGLSPAGQGLITLAAGGFMVLMGLSLLGILPGIGRLAGKLPGVFGRLTARAAGKGPLVVGLFGGLMPCGPLQAMQLYALGTGSAARGALSMLVFGLGTLPLMLALGTVGGLLTRRGARRIMAVGAAMVILMGAGTLRNGLGLMGVGGTGSGDAVAAEDGEKVQEIHTTLSTRGYPAITVEAGTPVVWTMTADQNSITGCNNTVLIPEYDLTVTLDAGENLIEFTPETPGVYTYSCWMGMIRSTITVTE